MEVVKLLSQIRMRLFKVYWKCEVFIEHTYKRPICVKMFLLWPSQSGWNLKNMHRNEGLNNPSSCVCLRNSGTSTLRQTLNEIKTKLTIQINCDHPQFNSVIIKAHCIASLDGEIWWMQEEDSHGWQRPCFLGAPSSAVRPSPLYYTTLRNHSDSVITTNGVLTTVCVILLTVPQFSSHRRYAKRCCTAGSRSDATP